MNIANNKYKIVEEDEERSDKMSVYSGRVIRNAMNKKDNNTDSNKTAATATSSQYSMFLRNKNISAPNTPSATEVDKTEKPAMSGFYDDSYYMAIHNKSSHYVADESYIFLQMELTITYTNLQYKRNLELWSIVYINNYLIISYLDLLLSTIWTGAYIQLWTQ
jgi:hypothetical protein